MTEIDHRINEIRDNLAEMAQGEYKVHDYTPHKTSAKELKEPKENKMELQKYGYEMYRMAAKKEHRKRVKLDDKKDDDKEVGISILDLDGSQFNVIGDETEYIDWRKLERETKKKLYEEFIEKMEGVEDDMKSKLLGEGLYMIDNGGLNTKKEIVYDKINGNILNIPAINYEEGIWKDMKVRITKKKKTMKNINKIIKKK